MSKRSVETDTEINKKVKKTFLCDECNKTFNTITILKLHKNIHLGKSFECPFEGCGLVFTQRVNMETHEMTHRGIKNFHCTFDGCNSIFSRKAHLTRHEQTTTFKRKIKRV